MQGQAERIIKQGDRKTWVLAGCDRGGPKQQECGLPGESPSSRAQWGSTARPSRTDAVRATACGGGARTTQISGKRGGPRSIAGGNRQRAVRCTRWRRVGELSQSPTVTNRRREGPSHDPLMAGGVRSARYTKETGPA